MDLSLRTLALGLTASLSLATLPAQIPTGDLQPKPAPELERGPQQHRRIALTFDAGGGDEDLPVLLRVLEREEVMSTFFLTGKWASAFPAGAAQIVAHGHVIGNHTWGHKDLTKLTDPEIAQELLRADDQFVSAFGCRYLRLFRAPYGEVDDRVLRVVEKFGFRPVRWSIDTLDSMEPRKTAAFIEHRVLDCSDEELCGAIVLMHVGYPETCAALPVIIHNLRERGFEFVPVAVWVATPPPTLAKFRTSALLPHSSFSPPGLLLGRGVPFDDQAMKAVFSTVSASTPEPQILEAWHRWTGPAGFISNHHTTATKP